MKLYKSILIFFPLIVLVSIGWYIKTAHILPSDIHNKEQKPLTYKDNTVQCPQCHMYLVGQKDTAQIITTEGKTHFLDDVGCAILWLRDQKISLKQIRFWVFTRDSQTFIEANKAFYSIKDHTPMKYGFGAYEHVQTGYIDFEEMRLRMLRGENMSNPKIRKKLLGE